MKTLLALFVALLLGTSAQAQLIIFDNGLTGETVGSLGADTGSQGTMSGNVFSPLVTGNANHVVFNGIYSSLSGPPLPTNHFTLTLYSVTQAGTPDTVIASSTLTNESITLLGPDSNQDEVFQFTGDLTTSLDLTLGTSYYLGFSNADSPTYSFGLAYSASGPATQSFTRSIAFGLLDNSPTPFQFQLSDTTAAAPEPSSYALGLVMLALIAFEIRRRRALTA